MEHVTYALARALNIAPPNDEGRSTPHASAPDVQSFQPDFDSSRQKQQATYTAKLALLGYTLSELSDSTYLVSRWDRSRHLVDLHAVAMFLRQAGGSA